MFSLTPVQNFSGALEAKKFVGKVDYILKDEIHGPECIVIKNGALYTGTTHGELVKIVNDKIVKKIVVADNPECSKISYIVINSHYCRVDSLCSSTGHEMVEGREDSIC